MDNTQLERVQHDFFTPTEGGSTIPLPEKYFSFRKDETFVSELGHLFCKEGKCFVVVVGVEKRVASGHRDISRETLLYVVNDGQLEPKRIVAFKDAVEVTEKIETIIYHTC